MPLFEDDDLLARLINGARFPWVIIVPKIADIHDLHDLPGTMFFKSMGMVQTLGSVMMTALAADKINIAAIDNMVPQLHIHVVSRTRDDAAWLAPIWGVGEMLPLDQNEIKRRVSLILDGLDLS